MTFEIYQTLTFPDDSRGFSEHLGGVTAIKIGFPSVLDPRVQRPPSKPSNGIEQLGLGVSSGRVGLES